MSGFSRRSLGKTGLQVSPLGIGGGSAIESEDVLYGFEQGINFFLFSSDLHHYAYQKSAAALKQLCNRKSVHRQEVVLATISYVNDPKKLSAVIADQFLELDLEYVDLFYWGWITDDHDVVGLLNAASMLKEGGVYTSEYRQFEAMMHQASEINQSLHTKGLARCVGMSFHSRRAAYQVMNNIDAMMVRYNIARTSMEQDLFAKLSGNKQLDPGIIAFNAGHEKKHSFAIPPSGYPATLPIPSLPDCYRFVLSNPRVDSVMTGVKNRQEIDEALVAMEKGPLTKEEHEFLRIYGSLFV